MSSPPQSPRPRMPPLPVAVAMARLAFNAYNKPVGSVGEAGNGRSTVAFFDKDFVSKTFSDRGGLLEVKVVARGVQRGADLHAVLALRLGGGFGAGDAVHLEVPRSEAKSQIMQFFVRDTSTDSLVVALHDEGGQHQHQHGQGEQHQHQHDEGHTQSGCGGLTLLLSDPDIPRLPSEAFKTTAVRLEEPPGGGGRAKGEGIIIDGGEVLVSYRLRPFAHCHVSECVCCDSHQHRRGWNPLRIIFRGMLAIWSKLIGASKPAVVVASEREQLTPRDGEPDSEQPQQPQQPQDDWSRLCGQVGATDANMVPVAFVDCRRTDTQVWLHRNTERREVVVAFRGTEQNKLRDWLTDIAAKVVDARLLEPDYKHSPPAAPGSERAAAAEGHKCGKAQEVLVHKGFLQAYESVRGTVRSLINAMTSSGSWDEPVGDEGTLGQQQQPPPYTVTFTGHSLGGALATLAAYDVAVGKRESGGGSPTTLRAYTFGSPRVGNVRFMESYNLMIREAWRVSTEHDFVARVPDGARTFFHAGHHWELGTKKNHGPDPIWGKEADEGAHRRTVLRNIFNLRFWFNLGVELRAHMGDHYHAAMSAAAMMMTADSSYKVHVAAASSPYKASDVEGAYRAPAAVLQQQAQPVEEVATAS